MYDSVISLIKAQAKYSKAVEPTSVNKRICSDNDSIYLDLGNPDWKLVKITSDGTSIVEHGKNSPTFSRVYPTVYHLCLNLSNFVSFFHLFCS